MRCGLKTSPGLKCWPMEIGPVRSSDSDEHSFHGGNDRHLPPSSVHIWMEEWPHGGNDRHPPPSVVHVWTGGRPPVPLDPHAWMSTRAVFHSIRSLLRGSIAASIHSWAAASGINTRRPVPGRAARSRPDRTSRLMKAMLVRVFKANSCTLYASGFASMGLTHLDGVSRPQTASRVPQCMSRYKGIAHHICVPLCPIYSVSKHRMRP
jgi:hypothetical protein